MKRIFQVLIALLTMINLAFAALDINTASESELDKLPGIGPAKAKAIVEDRKANGPFKSPEDIKRVKGIGDKTFEELKSQITVKGGSVSAPSKAETKPSAPPTATAPAPKIDAKPVATPLPVRAAAKPAADVKSQPMSDSAKPAGLKKDAPKSTDKPIATDMPVDAKSATVANKEKIKTDTTDKVGSKPKKAKGKPEDKALDKGESTGNTK